MGLRPLPPAPLKPKWSVARWLSGEVAEWIRRGSGTAEIPEPSVIFDCRGGGEEEEEEKEEEEKEKEDDEEDEEE